MKARKNFKSEDSFERRKNKKRNTRWKDTYLEDIEAQLGTTIRQRKRDKQF